MNNIYSYIIYKTNILRTTLCNNFMKKSLLVFENGGTYLKLTRQVLPCPPNNSLGVVKDTFLNQKKEEKKKKMAMFV